MLPFVAAALVAPFNRLLARNPWAPPRLAAFAGKTVELRVFPAHSRLRVTAEGFAEPAGNELAADTTIILTPALALRIAAGDDSAREQATVEGDAAFAQEIAYLARHLRWDLEEDLSKVFGDVLAHRLGESARGLNRWRIEVGNNLAENFRDYWVQERPLVAPRGAVEQFNRDVDRLRDDVERLEKRLGKLADR